MRKSSVDGTSVSNRTAAFERLNLKTRAENKTSQKSDGKPTLRSESMRSAKATHAENPTGTSAAQSKFNQKNLPPARQRSTTKEATTADNRNTSRFTEIDSAEPPKKGRITKTASKTTESQSQEASAKGKSDAAETPTDKTAPPANASASAPKKDENSARPEKKKTTSKSKKSSKKSPSKSSSKPKTKTGKNDTPKSVGTKSTANTKQASDTNVEDSTSATDKTDSTTQTRAVESFQSKASEPTTLIALALSSKSPTPTLGLEGLRQHMQHQLGVQGNALRSNPKLITGKLAADRDTSVGYIQNNHRQAIVRAIKHALVLKPAAGETKKAELISAIAQDDDTLRATAETELFGPKATSKSIETFLKAHSTGEQFLDQEVQKQFNGAIDELQAKSPAQEFELKTTGKMAAGLSEHVEWIVNSNNGNITHYRPSEPGKEDAGIRAGKQLVAENLGMLNVLVKKSDLQNPERLHKIAAEGMEQFFSNQIADLSASQIGNGHRVNLFNPSSNQVAWDVRIVEPTSYPGFAKLIVGANFGTNVD